MQEHVHRFGAFEVSRMAGTSHRKCLEPECAVISLDSYDDEPFDGCEVCGRSGKAADRCKFGHRSGLCSCWGGLPCGNKSRKGA